MSRNFVIKTTYKADGKDVLKTQSKMSRGFSRFASGMADGNSVIGKSFSRMSKGIDKIAQVGLIALISMIGLATNEYIKFQSAMSKVETIADKTTLSFENQRKKLIALSTELGVDKLILAEAQYQAISAGVSDSTEALELVKVAAKGAIGGFTDTATAVDGLTTVLNAYDLESEKAIKISDQMIATQNFGKTTFDAIARSMGKVIPIASALGVESSTLFGAIATLTKQGVQTPEAFTGIKAALSNILKPASEASKVAKKLGLDFSAAALKEKGFAAFLQDIVKKTGGSEQKIAKLFGSVEALNAVLALTKNGGAAFGEAIEAIENSAGATEKAFEKMSSTLGFRFNKLKIRFSNTMTEIGDAIAPLVNKILDEVDKIDIESIVKKIQDLDLNPILSILEGIKKVFGFVAKNWKIMLSLAAGIKAVAAAMVILNVVTTLFGVILSANVIGIVIVAIAALAAGITWLVLNWDKVVAVLKKVWDWIANVGQKFLLLVPIYGLLISGIIEVIKQFGKIKEAFQTEGIIAGLKAIGKAFLEGITIPLQTAWDLLKTFGGFLAETFGPVLKDIGNWFVELGKNILDAMLFPIEKAIELIGFLIDKWGDLKTAFMDGSILTGILNIGRTLISALLAPMQAFLELVSNVPGVGNLASKGAQKIADLRAGLNAPTIAQPEPTFNVPKIGKPETPTPITPVGEFLRSSLDINIRNSAGDNAEIKQSRNIPQGTNINFKPAFSL